MVGNTMCDVPHMTAKFLQENGMVAQYSMLGEPQSNGVAKIRNCNLMNMTSYSTLLISLWMEVLKPLFTFLIEYQ